MRNVKKIKVGDTVRHELLGEGSVIRVEKIAWGLRDNNLYYVQIHTTSCGDPELGVRMVNFVWLLPSEFELINR